MKTKVSVPKHNILHNKGNRNYILFYRIKIKKKFHNEIFFVKFSLLCEVSLKFFYFIVSDANSTTTTSTTSSPETTFLPTIAPLETTTMKDSTTEMPTTVTNMTPTTTPSSRNGKGRAMSDTNDTIKGSLEDLNLDDIDMDILDMKNTTSTQSTTNRSNNESINKILNSTNSSSQGRIKCHL